MVKIFDKTTFEQALPRSRCDGLPLWRPLGLVNNEYAYLLPVRDRFAIIIRSSVNSNGRSAGTGEDSIRCWIVAHEPGYPSWGSKISKYITRTPGWEKRLIETLKKLYKLALHIRPCKCGKFMKIVKVKKGNNAGKFALACFDCKHEFEILRDAE